MTIKLTVKSRSKDTTIQSFYYGTQSLTIRVVCVYPDTFPAVPTKLPNMPLGIEAIINELRIN